MYNNKPLIATFLFTAEYDHLYSNYTHWTLKGRRYTQIVDVRVKCNFENGKLHEM